MRQRQPNQNDKKAWQILLFVIALLICSWIYQYYQQKPVEKIEPYNEKPMRDSILLERRYKEMEIRKSDSLLKRLHAVHHNSSQIEIIYLPQYVFIKGASATELDSAILLAVFGPKQ